MARRTDQLLKIAVFFNFLQNRSRSSFFRITRRSARVLSLRRSIYKLPAYHSELKWISMLMYEFFVI